MARLRPLLVTAALAVSLMAALPASADSWRGRGRDYGGWNDRRWDDRYDHRPRGHGYGYGHGAPVVIYERPDPVVIVRRPPPPVVVYDPPRSLRPRSGVSLYLDVPLW
jgi:hypothetical protein